jgi:hypothetical protein
MQELKQALETFAKARRIDGTGEDVELPDFADVASAWATMCLHDLRGDLLSLGLDISKALSEFDRGLKHPETLKDFG